MVSREQKATWAAEQMTLAKMRIEDDCLDWSCGKNGGFPGLSRVGGVDVSFFADGTYAIAAVVVPLLECTVLILVLFVVGMQGTRRKIQATQYR